MLTVFGRLPVTDSATRSRAGVRKASGEETAGEFATAVVSVYGDLAPGYARSFSFERDRRLSNHHAVGFGHRA